MSSRFSRFGYPLLVFVSALGGWQHSAVADPAASGASPFCGSFAPTKTSTLPQDLGDRELQIDCTAWQAFIALNWRADPAKPGQPSSAHWDDFGKPGDTHKKVWESYLEAPTVFGDTNPLWQMARPAVISLTRTSKFGDLDLTDIAQAGSGDHWLTSQRRELTYYEILMNRDEFEFIFKNKLTTAAGQLACAMQPGKPITDGPPIKPPYPPGTPLRGGINFPMGSQPGRDDTDCAGNIASYGKVGAMEIKAAWTPLPSDHSLDDRYLTAPAKITDPKTKQVRNVTVGLVGLHIARKRFPRAAWVWATFEQIDNDPDEAVNHGFSPPLLPANTNQKPSPGFSYFNPNCTPARDPVYGCVHNAPPTFCKPGVKPCSPYDAAMQITRINPVGSTANSVTAYVWGMLPPKSVFNYYRLIEVQWPQMGVPNPPPGPGLQAPLPMDNPMPEGAKGGPGQIVADTTLESFQQTSNSCMDCHVYGQIATPKLLQSSAANRLRKLLPMSKTGAPPYASDYSFLFATETKR